MAINIDDTTKIRALKILEDEQNQLDGAYSKQAAKGSPGMESEFIPETAELAQRKEKRITEDSKGTYSQREVTVKEKYYDESVVDEKEIQFKEDAETLQEVSRAYDNEIISLNNQIDAKKLQIVNLTSDAATGLCSMRSVGVGTTALLTFNKEVEFVKIYSKMAGPGYDPGTDNPFEPDATVHLNESYSGFGYKNKRENKEILIRPGAGVTIATGIHTDGSGSSIGAASLVDSTELQHQLKGATNPSNCVAIGVSISAIYDEIITLRKERDSYRNKLNIIKKSKSEKELSHWGYQNTKNEVNVRKNKNASAISAIKELDGADTIQEQGLVLHFDAANNSSYFGSGTTWYDISNDDYDDNGTINGGTFIEDPIDNQKNYFRFAGGSGTNNAGNPSQTVSFDITDTFFGDPDTVTVEMLAQITADSTFNIQNYGGMMFGWNQYEVWFKTPSDSDPLPALAFNLGTGELVGISPERVDTLALNNEVPLSDRAFDVFPANWAHYTFVMHKYDSNNGTVKDQLLNNKIYINGVSESIEELVPSALYNSSHMNFNNGAGKISGRGLDNQFVLPQEVALFRVYNKELTQAEITANCNEVKGRFSIY